MLVSRSLGGASVRLTVSHRSRARVALCAVAASGLKPTAAAFQSAATLTNRSGEGASRCGPVGDELEAWPTRT